MTITLDYTETLAKQLMSKHNLGGWRFAFDNAKQRLGKCSHNRKIISLSKNFIPIVNEAEIVDTILHEIAHAIVGHSHGHDAVWQRKAIEIGCNGEQYFQGEARVKSKYIGTCPSCGKTATRHRLTDKAKRVSCGSCCRLFNGGKYSKDYRYQWRLND